MLMEPDRIYASGMDALVTACSWNTNGFMPWAWMLLSPHALGTRTDLCFGHGCSGHRMLLAHERIYALGMDALVTVTRTDLCLGHGCSGHRMLLEHERTYALGMDALVTACSWNTNGFMPWAWMLLSPYALGTRTELCLGHGCSGHRMLLAHERIYALGMDALVTVCSWNTNGLMPWAWMLWSPYAHGTGTDICFGHGCSGHGMLLEHERIYALGMDALVTVCSWNTNGIMLSAWMLWSPYALGTRAELCFGHGCSGHSMVFEHERNYALGMDALVTVCSWNTNGIMLWAWMLWSPYALQHERKANKCKPEKKCVSLLLKNERNYALGMDALVTVCSWNTSEIMLRAWMLWSQYGL